MQNLLGFVKKKEFLKMEINCENNLEKKKIREINPLVLAFLGDAIHTAFVREKVVLEHSYSAGLMHKESSKFCSATHQSLVFDKLQEILTEEEQEIALRARNAKNSHTAKHSSLAEYKKATSFEALLGYLYLAGENDRLQQFLDISM